MPDDDHETWLLNESDRVIGQKTTEGWWSLTPLARLTYCLWVTDYGMRNAGDLMTAADLHPTFLTDGKIAAQELGLLQATAAFSLTPKELESQYFDLFDNVVAEIRTA